MLCYLHLAKAFTRLKLFPQYHRKCVYLRHTFQRTTLLKAYLKSANFWATMYFSHTQLSKFVLPTLSFSVLVNLPKSMTHDLMSHNISQECSKRSVWKAQNHRYWFFSNLPWVQILLNHFLSYQTMTNVYVTIHFHMNIKLVDLHEFHILFQSCFMEIFRCRYT